MSAAEPHRFVRHRNHSPERERKGFDTRIEEGDREVALTNGAFLSDELVQPLPGYLAGAVGGGVDASILARRGAVHCHLEAYRLSSRRTENQMKVARVEAEGDRP